MLKRTGIACVALAIASGPPSLPSQGTTAYVIDNVNVVDVVAGTILATQRVVIEGSRITSVAPASTGAALPNAVLVDGRGKYLIPGMWDMHVHVAGLPETGQMLGLFLANGITGVRDMDANPLADIRNVARVQGVWRGGQYLGRSTIDLMLDGFAKAR